MSTPKAPKNQETMRRVSTTTERIDAIAARLDSIAKDVDVLELLRQAYALAKSNADSDEARSTALLTRAALVATQRRLLGKLDPGIGSMNAAAVRYLHLGPEAVVVDGMLPESLADRRAITRGVLQQFFDVEASNFAAALTAIRNEHGIPDAVRVELLSTLVRGLGDAAVAHRIGGPSVDPVSCASVVADLLKVRGRARVTPQRVVAIALRATGIPAKQANNIVRVFD